MKKKGTILMSIGIVFLTMALCLTGYNIYESEKAEKISDEVLEVMVSNLEEDTEKHEEAEIPEYELFPDKEMPSIEIDKERYIGILEMPSLGLSLPIMGGEWSYAKLKKAPCRYSGSVYRNSLVIAGHNYRSHFSKIKNLQNGDEIYFVDAEGNTFYYTVGWIEVLQATDVEAMQKSDEWDMTLFTCTYGGENRYAVRCIRTQ